MSIVAKTYRGDIVDLTHIGHIAVVDHKGQILHYFGDPKRVTFARSSAKPIQAIPVVESGAVEKYGIDKREIALFTASHSGEDFHVKAAESILDKAGLSKNHLQCGIHYPLNAKVRDKMKREGLEAETIHNNCSGKHAGMLVTTKYYGDDLESYYKKDHPTQKRILKTIADICQYEEEKIILGVDGCGVPVHAMPLYKFAQGYARLSKPELFEDKRKEAIETITTAMTEFPEMVAGTDRVCTDLMKVAGDKLFAKSGAAAFYAIGLKGQGIGIALKIEDGNSKIIGPVVLEVLAQLGLLDKELEELKRHSLRQITNHKKEVVGDTKVVFKLKE